MSCECPVPEPHPNHRYRCCAKCSKVLDPRILDTDDNVAVFYTAIADLPEVPAAAIEHAYQRLVTGRKEFGLEYLSRNNPAEGQEEQADSQNYALFQWLCDRRNGLEEIDPDLLVAAHHSALAHEAFERVRRKRGDRTRPRRV